MGQPSESGLTGVPMPLAARPGPAPRRDLWLRLALFASLAGAALTIFYARLLARQDALSLADASGLGTYHGVLVPLLALAAVAGALVLERSAVLGMVLLLLGCGLGLPGGAVWLLPGAVLGCVWAARHQFAARATLGFLLLVPGVAAVYYGLLGWLSYDSSLPARGLPPGLANPLSLRQALAPMELLPLALLGAWLLLTRPSGD